MPESHTLWLLSCSPLAVTLAAWVPVLWRWHRRTPAIISLIALGFATVNAALAAGLAIHYKFQPAPLRHSPPPWNDPQEGAFGLFFALAPLAMVAGIFAAIGKAPKWLVAVVELSSIPLFIIGFYAAAGI